MSSGWDDPWEKPTVFGVLKSAGKGFTFLWVVQTLLFFAILVGLAALIWKHVF